MNLKMVGVILGSLLLLGALAEARMGMMQGGGPGMMRGGMMNMSMQRHHYAMRNGLPREYAGKGNPLANNADNLAQGEKLYQGNCAACHGPQGRGDGPAGENLNPRPANIARFAKMPMASDAYLYWTISEGGTPVNSAMPPFKNVLKEEEIWQIITYLRKM
jgi:mono/diheme cytochrome c family protein